MRETVCNRSLSIIYLYVTEPIKKPVRDCILQGERLYFTGVFFIFLFVDNRGLCLFFFNGFIIIFVLGLDFCC